MSRAKLIGFKGNVDAKKRPIKPQFEVNLVQRDGGGNPTGKRIRSQYWEGNQLSRDFNDAGEYRAK